MAPIALDNGPTKRSVSMNDFDLPITKKRKLRASHRLVIEASDAISSSQDVTFNGDAQVELLLTRSIALALEAVGFEASEPLALESFRLMAEEYMHGFLTDVRHSMLSCRRTECIAPDFLQSLHIHQLSLRALLPHLAPPVRRKKAQITLVQDIKQEEEHCDHRFLGAELNGTADQETRSYIPRHFPSLPSKHTYQATREFPTREEDPRKIRERAAEEGRLAEEALRRLISAKSNDRPRTLRGGRSGKSTREQRDDLWKETMQAATSLPIPQQSRDADAMDLNSSTTGLGLPGKTMINDGRISSAVNAEQKYWRRAAPARASGQGGNDGG
ncbi:MAG: hypothetical protein Q9168_006761 [Polycauliona sp. 1 TL-2023]